MSNAQITTKPAGSAIARNEFGATQLEERRETASTAVAAQARATIESRYVMAMRNPRDWDDVRTKLLRECERSSFAERAIFALPRKTKEGGEWVTKNIEGLTVRFAESVIRLAGNVLQSTTTLYDDEDKRLLRVTVTDLETNSVYERDIVLDKTIERRDARDRVVLSQRTNSFGDTVFLVACTDDEILQKEGVIVSKTFRTLSLRFLPADIIEDCNEMIRATRAKKTKENPEAAKKSIVDAFAGINVFPSHLKLYLGHEVDQSSPAELDELRGLFAAIREKEVTWAEALAEKTTGADAHEKSEEKKGATGAKTVADRIRTRIDATKKAKKPAAPSDAGPSTATPSPATSSTVCLVCGEPCLIGGVATTANGKTGIRHPACAPFGVQADREPPPDVKTATFDEDGVVSDDPDKGP